MLFTTSVLSSILLTLCTWEILHKLICLIQVPYGILKEGSSWQLFCQRKGKPSVSNTSSFEYEKNDCHVIRKIAGVCKWVAENLQRGERRKTQILSFNLCLPSLSLLSPLLPFPLLDYLMYKWLLLSTLLRILISLYLAWHIATFQYKRLQNSQEAVGVFGLAFTFEALTSVVVTCHFWVLLFN